MSNYTLKLPHYKKYIYYVYRLDQQINLQNTRLIQLNKYFNATYKNNTTNLALFNILFGWYRDADKSGTYPIYLFALARQIVITTIMDL